MEVKRLGSWSLRAVVSGILMKYAVFTVRYSKFRVSNRVSQAPMLP